MDLNINNYSVDDLLKIFNINLNSYEIEKLDPLILSLQLEEKINKLKYISNHELTDNDMIDNKTVLIDFFYKSYIKLSGIVKDLKKNDIISQDGHFLVGHRENKNTETFNLNFKGGLINPLTIKTLNKVININTRFRDNYFNTSSTDFIIYLPFTLKKVLNIRVINYSLPSTVYPISCKLGSNCFLANDKFIFLTNGSYSPESVVEEINTRMCDASLNIHLEYNEIDGKMTFVSLDGCNFTLNFNFIEQNTDLTSHLPNNINKAQLTIGWILGFRGNFIDKNLKRCDSKNNFIYSDCDIYISESIYDCLANNYFLLSVNDFQNNNDTIFISPFQYQSMSDNNILAKILTKPELSLKFDYPNRIYFGPTDITKLHIKLYDEFGRIVDANNADYSIEIACELLYDL